MTNFHALVQKASNLDELCSTLNAFEQNEDHLPLSECTDLCSLPTFSDNVPQNTMEVFSWDSERVLIDNSGVLEGDNWILAKRCRVCGNAVFNCEHGEYSE